MKTEPLVYICSAGESFDSVALRAYGKEKYAAQLLLANPALCRTPTFQGGEKLVLPALELPAADSGKPYVPDRAPWKE